MSRLSKLFTTPHALLAIAIVVVGYLAWSTVDVISRNWEQQQKVNKLEAEIAILKLQNEKLRYSIEYYKTDEFIEQAGKDKLGLKLPDEKVIIVPKSELAGEEDEEAKAKKLTWHERAVSNFSEWLDFLFPKLRAK